MTEKNEVDKRGYVKRLHDQQLEALISSRRNGTYLLVGRSGSGKTSAIRALSDGLIANNVEHQIIPCGPHAAFVPPLARINFFDDIDLAVSLGSTVPFISSIEGAGRHVLNIVTSRPPEAERLRQIIQISGEIVIPNLSEEESQRLYDWFTQRSNLSTALDSGFRQLVQTEISQGRLGEPRTLKSIAQGVFGAGNRFIYRSVDTQPKLELIKPQIIKIQNGLVRHLMVNPEFVSKLSPIEVEYLVGELFEKEGYEVEFTQKTRDGGVDIFAWRRDIAGETLVIAQCKRYSPDHPVSVGVVREVAGSMNIHNATAAAIFTTSRFTKASVDEAAKIQHRLSLHDYFDVLQSIAKHTSAGDGLR